MRDSHQKQQKITKNKIFATNQYNTQEWWKVDSLIVIMATARGTIHIPSIKLLKSNKQSYYMNDK